MKQNKRYEVREQEPMPFLFEDLKVYKFNNGVCREWHGVFGWDLVERESEWSKRFEGKLKRFKNWPNFCQTRVFRDWNESPGLAAKTLKDKILKKISSVFRDWKVYPRGSRELSRENLCATLATGPFTREQFAKINTWARSWISRLGWPVTESPKQDNTVFEIF